MNYTHFEVNRIVKSMVILVDTREQNTEAFRRRIDSMECPIERVKLNYGDYSARCTLPDGSAFSLENKVVIERKMNLDELCGCYIKGRDRFRREFERANADKARVYLLVENATWEKLMNGLYRSKLHSNALFANMVAWSIRYRYTIWFCKSETSGIMIREILKRELKELLENEE